MGRGLGWGGAKGHWWEGTRVGEGLRDIGGRGLGGEWLRDMSGEGTWVGRGHWWGGAKGHGWGGD